MLERYINVWHIITIMRRKAAIQRRGNVMVNPNFVKINPNFVKINPNFVKINLASPGISGGRRS